MYLTKLGDGSGGFDCVCVQVPGLVQQSDQRQLPVGGVGPECAVVSRTRGRARCGYGRAVVDTLWW
jgi:hypothetical protein